MQKAEASQRNCRACGTGSPSTGQDMDTQRIENAVYAARLAALDAVLKKLCPRLPTAEEIRLSVDWARCRSAQIDGDAA